MLSRASVLSTLIDPKNLKDHSDFRYTWMLVNISCKHVSCSLSFEVACGFFWLSRRFRPIMPCSLFGAVDNGVVWITLGSSPTDISLRMRSISFSRLQTLYERSESASIVKIKWKIEKTEEKLMATRLVAMFTYVLRATENRQHDLWNETLSIYR